MVEIVNNDVSTSEALQTLFNSAPMKHVLDMFDLEDKLFLRTVSKKLCSKVTETFHDVVIELQDEAEDQQEVFDCTKQLRNIERVTFMNFTINQHNLEVIENFINNNSNSIKYLHLSFEGDGEDAVLDKYVELFSKITLKSFELTCYEDGGSSDFFDKLSSMDHPWFSTVKILRIFEIYEVKNKESLQNFLTQFKDVHSLRTLCTEQFNPYVKLIETKKAIGELQATYTTDQPSKEQLERYIACADIRKVALYGGDLNNVDLTIQPLPTMTGLKLKDMPNVNLQPFLEKLPTYTLENLELIRLEQITREWFDQYILPCLLNSPRFRKFRFEINHENFNGCFPAVIQVVTKHVAVLEHLSFAKTPISTEQIGALVDAIKSASAGERSALKVVDLCHVFANDNFSFTDVISKLSEISTPANLVNVWVSRY